MRIRPISVLAVLALVLAACSPSNSEPASTTTSNPVAATTTTSTVPEVDESPDAMLLSYSLEPGSSMDYEVDIDQTINMTATGDASAMGDEEFPGELSVNVSGTTSFSHSVAEGPEPGTYEITITGDVSGLSFSGTMDGAPIDNGEIPDLATIDPVDVTIIVDEQGNIIPADDEFGDLLGGGFGDFGSLGNLGGSGTEMGRFIGPPFADREVTVGDSWSETIETPMPMGDAPVVTTIDNQVTGVDTIDGSDVLVIETTSTTSMIEFDLAEFLVGFFLAFVPEDATAEESAQLDAIAEGLKFLFVIDETVSDMTTWFDAEAGLARKADFSSSTHLVMDINMPDEETNELIAFGLDMNVSQDVTYRLISAESA